MKGRGAGRLKCSRSAPLLSRGALARTAAKMGGQRLRRRDRNYQHARYRHCIKAACGYFSVVRPCGARREIRTSEAAP